MAKPTVFKQTNTFRDVSISKVILSIVKPILRKEGKCCVFKVSGYSYLYYWTGLIS